MNLSSQRCFDIIYDYSYKCWETSSHLQYWCQWVNKDFDLTFSRTVYYSNNDHFKEQIYYERRKKSSWI